MPSLYDENDLHFSYNGDLTMSDTGDLKDASDDPLLPLKDQIHNICMSTLQDWEVYPGRGAGLEDFVGEPNTKTTAVLMQDRLRLALVSGGVVREEDLAIRVFPVHIHKLMAIIRVDATSTAANKLNPQEKVQTALVFDTVSRQVFFLDKTPQLIPPQ